MNIFLFFFFFFIRRKQRQKSRRQRKMEILKRQKWRPRSLLLHFAALSNQPGQHCVAELVLSVILRNSLLFTPMFSHCTGVFKESGHTSFFMKCYLLVFKMSFFSLVLVGPHHEISSFHFTRFYFGVLEAQSLLYQC